MVISFNSIQDPYGIQSAGSSLGQALMQRNLEMLQNTREIQREQRGEAKEGRQYELNRQRLTESLKGLKNLDTSNLTQPQIIAAYAEALGNVPGGSQILSEILPVALKQSQNKQLFPGQSGSNSQIQTQQQSQLPDFMGGSGQKSPLGNVMPELNQAGSAFNAITPRGMTGAAQSLTPVSVPPKALPNITSREEALQTASNSSDPFSVLDFYARANKFGREQRQDLWNEYANQYEAQSNAIARENQFRGFVKKATADKKYSSDEINRLTRYSEKYLNEPSLTQRLYFAEQDLKKFNNAVAGVQRARNAPNFMENLFRGKNDAIQQVSVAVKPLVELGEIDLAKKELSDLGFGPLDTESIVNPLSKSVLQSIAKLPRATPTVTSGGTNKYSPNIPAPIFGTGKKLEERRMKQVEDLSSSIFDIIEKGGPNTSLKLIKDQLFKEKGYTENEFNYALNKSLENGLKLSDRQKVEQTELGRSSRRSLIDIWLEEGVSGVTRSLRGFE